MEVIRDTPAARDAANGFSPASRHSTNRASRSAETLRPPNNTSP